MDRSRTAAPCAKLTLLGIVLAAAGAAAEVPGEGPPRFVDVAAESGLTIPVIGGSAEKKQIVESTTGGVALFDQDGDGDLEVFFANGSRLGGFPEGEEPRASLYRNHGKWRFAEAAGELGAAHAGWGMGVAAVDWDGDGRVDLYLANYGANALYRNEGERFREVAGAAGVAHPGWGSAAAFGDYDGDGDLDFYLANYVDFDPGFVPEDRGAYCNWRGLTDVFCGPNGLPGARDSYFRNEGPESGWVFADAGDEAGLREYEYYGLGAVAGDYDDDGDLDVYVANDSTPNVLYRNDGGRFVDIAVAAGAAFEKDGREQSGMGVAAGDPDGDGDVDLFVTISPTTTTPTTRTAAPPASSTSAGRPASGCRACRTWAGEPVSSTATTTATRTCSSPTGTSSRRSTAAASGRGTASPTSSTRTPVRGASSTSRGCRAPGSRSSCRAAGPPSGTSTATATSTSPSPTSTRPRLCCATTGTAAATG